MPIPQSTFAASATHEATPAPAAEAPPDHPKEIALAHSDIAEYLTAAGWRRDGEFAYIYKHHAISRAGWSEALELQLDWDTGPDVSVTRFLAGESIATRIHRYLHLSGWRLAGVSTWQHEDARVAGVKHWTRALTLQMDWDFDNHVQKPEGKAASAVSAVSNDAAAAPLPLRTAPGADS